AEYELRARSRRTEPSPGGHYRDRLTRDAGARAAGAMVTDWSGAAGDVFASGGRHRAAGIGTRVNDIRQVDCTGTAGQPRNGSHGRDSAPGIGSPISTSACWQGRWRQHAPPAFAALRRPPAANTSPECAPLMVRDVARAAGTIATVSRATLVRGCGRLR
ncbi:MAG TPA: hypothetical protein VNR64_12435, partial [Vicinamibacterales bacterium]|nr:hypothetical protein [Vicinamibacterales bacterium]